MFEKTLDYSQVPSPCFVLDEARLRHNMEILDDIQKRGNVKIICALSALRKVPEGNRRHPGGS